MTGIAMKFSIKSTYSNSCCITSLSASSFVACAVWPSCHRNSLVLKKSLVTFVSHLTILHHWFMSKGRSLQLLIHFEKESHIIVSDVGLSAYLSSSSFFFSIHATSGTNPEKCSA